MSRISHGKHPDGSGTAGNSERNIPAAHPAGQ